MKDDVAWLWVKTSKRELHGWKRRAFVVMNVLFLDFGPSFPRESPILPDYQPSYTCRLSS
jgi:hypothetical protein